MDSDQRPTEKGAPTGPEDGRGLDAGPSARVDGLWRSVRWVLAGLILLGGFLLFNYLAATEPDSPIPGGIESRSAADYSPWEDAQFRPLRPGAVGANGQDRSRDLRPLLCFLLPGCD